MHCYAIACLMSTLCLAFVYTMAFGSGGTVIWGGLDKAFLSGVSSDILS